MITVCGSFQIFIPIGAYGHDYIDPISYGTLYIERVSFVLNAYDCVSEGKFPSPPIRIDTTHASYAFPSTGSVGFIDAANSGSDHNESFPRSLNKRSIAYFNF